jgi:hypothetical protein
MRARITLSVATIALGAVVIAAPAFAQTYVYSNVQKSGAPLSPNGLAAGANSMGGPSAYGGMYNGPSTRSTPAAYSNLQKSGAPLSPNGLAAGANSFGGPGPGYIGPTTSTHPAAYSNVTSSGHPLSPNGLAAGANSLGGPGYQGN